MMLRAALTAIVLAFVAMSNGAAQTVPDDWRKKLGTFRIGVVGGSRPTLETRRLQPFKKALQTALKMPVEIFSARDYSTLIEAQVSLRIEYAVYSATAFSAAWNLCKCVEPVAVPTDEDGSHGFQSVLIARDGHVSGIRDLKGKVVVFPGKGSFSGYIVPRYALAEQGVDIDSAELNVVDMKTMEGAISPVLAGKADAIFGWQPNLEKLEDRAGTLAQLKNSKDRFRTVWASKIIPYGPHTVRKSLPRELKVLLSEFLVGLKRRNPDAYDAIEQIHGGGFIAISAGEFESVINLVRGHSATPSTKNAATETKKSP